MLSPRFVSTFAPSAALVSLALIALPQTARATTATTTTLTITSGKNAVTSVNAGTVVTLTATVKVGSAPVSPGLVQFCDAKATYCEDIHIIGTAQLTAAGKAVFKFRPGPGSHSYNAMFAGTNTYAASASAASSLSVGGPHVTNITLTASLSSAGFELTGTVLGAGAASTGPTGQVSFLDASNGNASLGTATLGTPAFTAMGITNMASYTTGDSPEGIAIADFNGDGIPDIAIPNSDSDSVTVLLGNGDGTFTPAASLATGTDPTAIATADFNGDGIPDLAVAYYGPTFGGGSVVVYLGKGDGTFTPVSASPGDEGSFGIAVADFNGDGIPDMAVASENTGLITILLGNGDGTFTPASSKIETDPLQGVFTGIVAADFNGDGMQDLAVTGSEGFVLVFEGNGDGTFTPFGSAIPVAFSYPGCIVSADFNGDGIPDLAVTGDTANSVVILLGLGNGTFTAATTPNGTTAATTAVAVGDFNGDGIPDLLAVNHGAAAVYQGNGDGTFSQTSSVSLENGGPTTDVYFVAASDLNGDGFPDLVAAGQNGTLVLAPGQAYVALIGPQFTSSTGPVSIAASPGTTAIQAAYAGDSNWAPSVSNAVVVQATILSPAPNSVLTGPAATFTWTQAIPGSEYQLWLGTTPGASDLFKSALSGSLSVTATGLPLNGKTIYARLFTDDYFSSGASPYVDYTFTASTPSALTSPQPGSTLIGPDVTFKWSPSGGASDYVLRLGTTPGSYDIHTTGSTTATSVTFSDLPLNGETIYARLYTIYPTAYVYTDYTYTAATQGQAALISPAPNSVLPGPQVTFNWTAGTGAASYILRLGSSAGADDIRNSGITTATSVTFSPLPVNGETIYARLYTNFASGPSAYIDYVYTAATQAHAVLTSPAPNSVLAGTDLTFSWSAAAGASAYILRLGTTMGAYDIRTSGPVTGTSVAFSALPTNGETIHARLVTLYPSGSVYTDYTFTAATQSVLESPAPNSVLTGSDVTFNWSTVPGAIGYKLRLGTSAGAFNIRTSGQITANHVTFSGLPTNGETIHARLYTIYSYGSAYTDYVLTAAP